MDTTTTLQAAFSAQTGREKKKVLSQLAWAEMLTSPKHRVFPDCKL